MADVDFEISDDAAAVIRDRGGRVWIWPDHYRNPHATTGPPAFHNAPWTTYAPDGLAVHVDDTIVLPTRWVISATPDRYVAASWNGRSPGLLGRVPLVRTEDATEEVEHPSSPLGHVRRVLVVPALAWIFAVLWALRYVGVGSTWLWAGRTALVSAISIAAFVAWLREKIFGAADATLG